MIDRIKQVMEYSQMSTKAFADTIKLNPSSLTHIFNGRNQASLDVVKKILTAFPEINSEWLVMGVGEMLSDGKTTPPAEPAVTYSTVDNMQQVDLFSAVELDSITPAPVVEEEVVGDEPVTEPESVVEPGPAAEEVAQVAEPVVQPASQPIVKPAPVSTPKRGRNAESHNSGRESRRERISNSQADKKLVKIVMFYDDRSFEEYFPS